MKRESKFFLKLAIVNLVTMFLFTIHWVMLPNQNDTTTVLLCTAVYFLNLFVMSTNLNVWAKYRLAEDRERANSKG